MKTYKLIIKRGDYTYVDMFTSYSAMVTWLYTKFDYCSYVDRNSHVCSYVDNMVNNDTTTNVGVTINKTYKFKDKLLTCGREYDVMFEVENVYGKHSHKSNVVIF